MKKLVRNCLIWLAVCAFGGTALVGPATELVVEGEVALQMVSPYVWRGRVIGSGPSFQPQITVWSGPVMLDIWGTWEWATEEGEPVSTRFDVSMDYTYETEAYSLSGGGSIHVYHDSPSNGDRRDTYEAYFSAELATFLSPNLTVYWDLGRIEGIYAKVGLRERFVLHELAEAVVETSFGAASGRYIENFFDGRGKGDGSVPTDEPAFVDFSISLMTPITVAEGLILEPRVEYTAVLDAQLKSQLKDDVEHVVGSITLRWAF